MFGIDWLKEHGCIWHFKTGNLPIDGHPVITPSRCGRIKCRRVLAQESQDIPPRSQKNIVARITLLSVHDSTKDVIVETHQLKPGLYVGRTLLAPQHRDVKVRVADTTSKPQLISVGSCLGQAVPVTTMTASEMDTASSDTTSVER